MNNKNEEVDVLNSLLQGSYIGIDSFSKCLNRIRDKNIRHKLEHQELEQREIAMELTSRIRDLGGIPKENAGAKGTMASIMGSLKVAENEDTGDILGILLEGAKMGVKSNEKALLKLDGPSREMIEKHLLEDKKLLEEMESMKNNIIKQ